jgi:hypothetical protein
VRCLHRHGAGKRRGREDKRATLLRSRGEVHGCHHDNVARRFTCRKLPPLVSLGSGPSQSLSRKSANRLRRESWHTALPLSDVTPQSKDGTRHATFGKPEKAGQGACDREGWEGCCTHRGGEDAEGRPGNHGRLARREGGGGAGAELHLQRHGFLFFLGERGQWDRRITTALEKSDRALLL